MMPLSGALSYSGSDATGHSDRLESTVADLAEDAILNTIPAYYRASSPHDPVNAAPGPHNDLTLRRRPATAMLPALMPLPDLAWK